MNRSTGLARRRFVLGVFRKEHIPSKLFSPMIRAPSEPMAWRWARPHQQPTPSTTTFLPQDHELPWQIPKRPMCGCGLRHAGRTWFGKKTHWAVMRTVCTAKPAPLPNPYQIPTKPLPNPYPDPEKNLPSRSRWYTQAPFQVLPGAPIASRVQFVTNPSAPSLDSLGGL